MDKQQANANVDGDGAKDSVKEKPDVPYQASVRDDHIDDPSQAIEAPQQDDASAAIHIPMGQEEVEEEGADGEKVKRTRTKTKRLGMDKKKTDS